MTFHKSEIQSAIATAIICVIILLILFFCGMTATVDQSNEGVMIALGVYEDGYGEQMPADMPTQSDEIESAPSTPTASESQINEEDLITQEEQSVAIDNEKKKKEQEEINRRREEEHQKRLEEQRERERKVEEERIKAQKQAEEQAAKDKANSMVGNAFKPKGSGSGQTVNDTQQGKPIGFGTQNGVGWSLEGWEPDGKLHSPSYSGNQEGQIVVNIRVDNTGRVTSASIAKGTDISDETLRKAAIEAAMKNRFTKGDRVAYGTLTYKFTLN